VKRALLDAGYARPMVPRNVHVELRSKVSLTIFDPRAAEGIGASYELRLGEDRFRGEVADGWFEVVRGTADRPDATIETDPATLATLVYDDRSVAEALRSGELEIGGDGSAVALRYPVPTARAGPSRRRGAAPLARPAKLLGTSLTPFGYVHVSPLSGTRMYLRYKQRLQTSQNHPRLRCQARLSNRKNQVRNSQPLSVRSILT
jgi:hypothetical protein